jgi:predicted ATP-grasp superfamily ATP-dependent carboligase
MTADHLRRLFSPDVRAPIVLAAFEGWNDAGDAASWAVRHLGDRWGAEPFAEIDPEVFFDFSTTRPMVELTDEGRVLRWPTTTVSVVTDPVPLVLVQGIEPQLQWRTYVEQVLAITREVGATMLVTVGALLAEVPHTRPVMIYGSSEDDALGARLELEPSTYEGPTGIVGILNAAAQEAGIPTVSLWAAVPNYVSGAASPKAALALVERIREVLSTPIPTTDLEIAASAYERQITELVSEDDDTAAYIASLEEAFDEGPDEPDPQALVEEVERFLRDQ